MVARSITVAVVLFGLASGVGCAGSRDRAAGTDQPGAALYQRLGCARCHGDQRQGTRTAPALAEVATMWTADELVAFLADPVPVVRSSSRLRRFAETYPARMGPVDASREELRTLAGYLLAP